MNPLLYGCTAAALLALAACSKETPVSAPATAIAVPASSAFPTGPASDPSLPPGSVAVNAPPSILAPANVASAPPGMEAAASAASAAMAPASSASTP